MSTPPQSASDAKPGPRGLVVAAQQVRRGRVQGASRRCGIGYGDGLVWMERSEHDVATLALVSRKSEYVVKANFEIQIYTGNKEIVDSIPELLDFRR